MCDVSMSKRNTSRKGMRGFAFLTCSIASAHSSSSMRQFGVQLTINTVSDGYSFSAFALSLSSICLARSSAFSPPLNTYGFGDDDARLFFSTNSLYAKGAAALIQQLARKILVWMNG